MASIQRIALDRVIPSKHNPRTVFDQEALHTLAASIRDIGVLQPVLVTYDSDSDTYKLIAGQRRWLASKLADQPDIPAIVMEPSAQVLFDIQIAENLEREQLNPIEEAQAFHRMIQTFQCTDEEIATRLKRNILYVRHRLQLLELPSEVQNCVIDTTLSIGAAIAISTLESPDAQKLVAQQAVTNRLSIPATKNLVAQIKKQQKTETLRQNKKIKLDQKITRLSETNRVVTDETFDKSQHHRIWNLIFPECASCTRTGIFVRPDSQVERICIISECYDQKYLAYREESRQRLSTRTVARRSAFNTLLIGDEVTTQHLQYLLWVLVQLSGHVADEWRNGTGVSDPSVKSLQEDAYSDWNSIAYLEDEQLLRSLVEICTHHLIALDNNLFPESLRQSLIRHFDVPSEIFEMRTMMDEA